MPRRSLLAIAILLASTGARAEPTPADRALATELFQQGRELMAEGKATEACDKFAESQRLDPGGGTLLNLGLCHEANGKLASAWTVLNEALGMARRDGRSERETIALEHIAAIEPRLSRLVIVVPAEVEVPGLTVLRDGTPVGRTVWGTAMPVDSGTHRIEVSAPGYNTWSTTVEISGDASNESISIQPLEPEPKVEPPAAPPLAPRPAPSAARPGSPKRDVAPNGDGQRLVGWIVGGVGVAGLGVGSYFGLRALSKQSDSDAECVAGCTTRGSELSNEAGNAADIATVSFAIGIAGVGAGAFLVLSAPSSSSSRVGVAIGPRTVRIGGRF